MYIFNKLIKTTKFSSFKWTNTVIIQTLCILHRGYDDELDYW